MTTDCIGCFAYNANRMKCEALSNTDFKKPCPFRKDKTPKAPPPLKRVCNNCFANEGDAGEGCGILKERYPKNCPFHKTREEYERGVNLFGVGLLVGIIVGAVIVVTWAVLTVAGEESERERREHEQFTEDKKR